MKKLAIISILALSFVLIFSSVCFAITAPSNLELHCDGGPFTQPGNWTMTNHPAYRAQKPNNEAGFPTGIRIYVLNIDTQIMVGNYESLADYAPEAFVSGSSLPDGRYMWQACSYYWGGASGFTYFGSPSWAEMDFGVDTTPPSNGTATETHGVQYNTWTNSNDPYFTLSGNDSGSGFKRYRYYFGPDPGRDVDTNNGSGKNIDPPPLSVSGIYYLKVKAEDNVGNPAPIEEKFIFKYDNSAPGFQSLSCNGPAPSSTPVPPNTWQNKVNNPTFNINGASDLGGSGFKEYKYYWGPDRNGNPVTTTIANAITPGAVTDGVWYFNLQIIDNAGNVTNIDNPLFTFKYDSTLPSNIYATEDHGTLDKAWQNNDNYPLFTLHGSDAGYPISGSGIKYYYYYFGTSPSVIPITDRSNPGVHFAVANSDQSAQLDLGGAVSSDGIYYLRVIAEDEAGNKTNVTTPFYFQYDHTSPNVSNIACGALQSGQWQNSITNPTFTVTASDSEGSGLKEEYYYYFGSDPNGVLNSQSSSNTISPGAIPSEGTYYFKVKSIDNAGNESDISQFIFRYDNSTPSISNITESGGCLSGKWQNSINSPAFTINTNDSGGSDVYRIYYYWGTDIDGRPDQPYKEPVTLGPVGSDSTYYLNVYCTDKAGNESDREQFIFKYDSTAPSGGMGLLSTTKYYRGVVQLSSRGAGDGLGSGISKVEYYRGSGLKIGSSVYSPYFRVNWNTSRIIGGMQLIYNKIYDKAGNVRTSSRQRVYIDNYKPKIYLPRSVTFRRGKSFYYKLTVKDPYTGSRLWVDIIIKKGKKVVKKIKKQVKPGVPDRTKINTTMTWPSGKYTVQVKATDKAGNQSTANAKMLGR